MERESLINEMNKWIKETFEINHTEMFPLHSLYLYEHRRKFVPGDQVVIESGKIVTGTNEVPTHEITLLEGTLADNKHSITLKDLSTHLTLKIDL